MTTSPALPEVGPDEPGLTFAEFTQRSIMPTYKNMFRNYVDFESVKPRMRALSTMPLDTYSDREIAEASKRSRASSGNC